MQSRVQMFLFKARLAAQKEYTELCAKLGVSADDVRTFLSAHPDLASGLRRSPHAAAGTAADRLAEIAPYIGKSDAEIRVLRAKALGKRAAAAVASLPSVLSSLRKRLQERAPTLISQAREEWVDAKPLVVERIRETTSRFTGKSRRASSAAAPAAPTL